MLIAIITGDGWQRAGRAAFSNRRITGRAVLGLDQMPSGNALGLLRDPPCAARWAKLGKVVREKFERKKEYRSGDPLYGI
jgi:hypothetical protein